MRIRERVDREELLDAGGVSGDDVRRSLSDLERMHRWLGGGAALTRFLYPCARPGARVLDVGCGSGLVSAEIRRWSDTSGKCARLTALDRSPLHLAIGLERGHLSAGSRVSGDAFALPFPDRSFDFVVTTLLLHHFAPGALRRILAELARVCRGRVIANDLIRDWVPALFFRLSTPFFARSWVTRHDGWASVRRAYTPEEWRALATELGWRGARVATHGLAYRMTLVYDVDGPS